MCPDVPLCFQAVLLAYLAHLPFLIRHQNLAVDFNILQSYHFFMSAIITWAISLELCRLSLTHIWQVVCSILALCLEILLPFPFYRSTYTYFKAFCCFAFLVIFFNLLLLSKFSVFFLFISPLVVLSILLMIPVFISSLILSLSCKSKLLMSDKTF